MVFKNTHNFTHCMVCFPNCKINLGLYVTNKRPDGFHDLETVFYPLMPDVATASGRMPDGTEVPLLNDILEISHTGKESNISLSGLRVAGSDKDNLVWKAYQLLKAEFGNKLTPLDIYLHKGIPMGAGVGGGSADGAFMLSMLNDFFSLGLSPAELAERALQLGSDCPFFVYNTPQFAQGRGEQMIPLSLSLAPYTIQLVCPAVHVSTRDAFARISPRQAPLDLRKLDKLHIEQWKNVVANDFEQSVFAIHPQLATIKEQLYWQGAIYASMTGSGSAIYGIFDKGKKANIVTSLEFREFFIHHQA